ncbi:MAG: hypothetical protein COB02_02870 [Candidatus Cloacimonadota bacterium]|nr:MAG: hypothetical protein COB02_02870 [Candidatus Cloacimonadota bacterium]
MREIIFFLSIAIVSLSAQNNFINSELMMNLLARIESLESRVRFLEEQLMKRLPVSSVDQKQNKEIGLPENKIIPKATLKVLDDDVYTSFFISKVKKSSWRLKKVSCIKNLENKKVDCEAQFRASGKVGRSARKVVKGLILLNKDNSPLRVFTF